MIERISFRQIEVNRVQVVERSHTKMQRKRRHTLNVDASKSHRSSRENRGSKMSKILGSLSHSRREVSNKNNERPNMNLMIT